MHKVLGLRDSIKPLNVIATAVDSDAAEEPDVETPSTSTSLTSTSSEQTPSRSASVPSTSSGRHQCHRARKRKEQEKLRLWSTVFKGVCRQETRHREVDVKKEECEAKRN